MNRLQARFELLRKEGRKALVGFLMGGDPDAAGSARDARTAVACGVDVLELGVPFSDPTADGPTIQAAALRSLDAGTRFETVLEIVAGLRKDCDVPVVLFGYANPLFRYGYARACADAAQAGADGLLVVDLPYEEADELRVHSDAAGLDLIQLVAPTSSPERCRTILSRARGFVYYIMVTGVTGSRDSLPAGVAEHVSVIRRVTKLPIVAGFGISTGAQARQAAACADGVVVGSAMVSAARKGRLSEFVTELRTALDAAAASPQRRPSGRSRSPRG